MGDVVHLDIGGQTHSIQVKEFRGQRVVTFRDIDELHQRPAGTAGRAFRENRHRFIEGEDFFAVPRKELPTNFVANSNRGNPNIEVILLTESGYLMLVKSFTDDLAWQVQRALVKSYFRAKEMLANQSKDNRLRELEVEARVRNARVREARMLHTMAKEFADILSPEAKQAMLSHATLVLTGERLIPLPKVEEPLFTAEEIAAELGVSANKVGCVANKYNLKTAEHGVWVLDKAKYSDKQVRTFLYNVRGREAVIEAVKRDMRMIPGDKE